MHFSGPDESKLTQITRVISEKKWALVKKVLPDGLKAARAVPDIGGNSVSVLPAMEHTRSVKVSRSPHKTTRRITVAEQV